MSFKSGGLLSKPAYFAEVKGEEYGGTGKIGIFCIVQHRWIRESGYDAAFGKDGECGRGAEAFGDGAQRDPGGSTCKKDSRTALPRPGGGCGKKAGGFSEKRYFFCVFVG